MKVLLTGATGLVGGHTARLLAEAGHRLRVLCRASSDLQNLSSLDCERVRGDVTQPETLEAAADGTDAVMHIAGVASWSPLHASRIRQVNVEGTRHLMEAARRSSTVRRVVVTSSVAAVGGTRKPQYLDERSEWTLGRLGIPYVTAKRDGEQLALGYAGDDLEVVVVNPGFVIGPGDIYGSSSAIVLQVVKGRLGGYTEGGGSFVDVRDVARGHVAALERGRSGDRYILGGENLTMTGFLEVVGRVAGVRPPRRVSYLLAWLAGRLADVRAVATGKPQPLSRNLVRASALFTFVRSRKAQEQLGYQIRDIETSIADTLRDFLQRGRLRPTTAELEKLAS